MKLHPEITNFLNTKLLSKNSKSSYTYDLQQFCNFFETRELTEASVTLFRKHLSTLAASAQKRKISAVNQFLTYLYQRKLVSDYYQLPKADTVSKKPVLPPLRDFSSFYGPIQSPGQFLACLILETGLTPAEIMTLSWSDFNWRFNVLEVSTGGKKRVLSLQAKFAVRAKLIQNADELFAKTRQYLHAELKKFTPYSARELREQFILFQVKKGKTIYDLAEELGLKTIVTLERYYKK